MNNNLMNSAYTDNVLLPSVTSIYFYSSKKPGTSCGHPPISFLEIPYMANWTFQHIPTTWPPSRAFLLADLGCSWKPLEAIGSHWKPLLAAWANPPMESTYELLGIIPPNRGGGTYAKKSKHQKKREANGDTRWKLQMDNWDGRWRSISTASHDKLEQKYAIEFSQFTPLVCFNAIADILESQKHLANIFKHDFQHFNFRSKSA